MPDGAFVGRPVELRAAQIARYDPPSLWQ